MTALVPPTVDADEEARLRALHALGITGTAAEERFDRITRLARQLFGVQIAALTLVDRDVQWVKSEIGFGRDSAPRADAFCNITIADPDTTVIEDARRDPRVAHNAYVVGAPHVRFYAGHPLRTTGGQPVGTLCVLDAIPREFDATQQAILRELAAWAESELNHSAEMDRAAEVQEHMLPRETSLDVPGYHVAGACWPARTVGGDFVDWYLAGDGDVVTTVGDVMGKGLGAALIMATVRAAMRTAGRELGAAAAVTEVARTLDADLQATSTLITLCHARLTPATGRVRGVNAGHGLMVRIGPHGEIGRARGTDPPLGVLPDVRWAEMNLQIRPGETFVAFSDGLLDFYPGVEDAFADVVATVVRDPRGLVGHVAEMVRRAPLADDVTVRVMHRCP